MEAGVFRRFKHDGVSRRQRGGQLPDGHQDREVPGNDLADYTERLVVVVRGGVVVQLGKPALLRPDGGGEVAEVVRGQRDVGGQRLAHSLAVVPGFGDRKHLQVLVDPVRNPVQYGGTLGDGGFAPARSCLMRGVEGQVDVFRGAAGHFTKGLAGHGRDVLEVLALGRGNPFAADPVLVARLEADLRTILARLCINSHC
jgi:hypothetical protein